MGELFRTLKIVGESDSPVFFPRRQLVVANMDSISDHTFETGSYSPLLGSLSDLEVMLAKLLIKEARIRRKYALDSALTPSAARVAMIS